VVQCSNGQEGKAFVDKEEFDLIIACLPLADGTNSYWVDDLRQNGKEQPSSLSERPPKMPKIIANV